MARSKKPQEANVGDYPERPLKDALADPKDIVEAENRPEKDQIEDYHKEHPTLALTPEVEAVTGDPQE